MTVATRGRVLFMVARPPVLALLALYTALGAAAGSRAHAGGGDALPATGRALLPVAAFLMFSVACNDLADERIDRVNLPGDRRRPLVSGDIGPHGMRSVAVVCAVVALTSAFLVAPWAAAVTAVGLGLSAAYSLRPVRIADRGALASLALPACYVAVPFLVGRLAAGGGTGAWAGTGGWPGGRELLLLAGLYVGFIGRILLKDFRDVRGDALFGKRTFLVRHGRVRTCRLSAGCWTLGSALLVAGAPGGPPPAFAAAVAAQLGVALWLLRRLAQERHPHREELLICAAAVVGRGVMAVTLAQLSMRSLHWSVAAQAAVLAAVLALVLGQTWTMLRYGPGGPRRYVPARYRPEERATAG
ncbi:UbiA family prenyltransferase [Streptomyces sp. RS10V-4]|uniref:UbiA family prenyltransferase n=1 Tax=Streptomyces rhizoryzae TaxID=2932493 RepID=UPI002005FB1E|nr:UbiA family prenyltransferase [Streptomyces rhizoryzae]MCK7622294.1 UbiA family prenyltransferase [Streptomyces rhizoryzae]